MFICAAGHEISTTSNENEFDLLSLGSAEQGIAEVGQRLHSFCLAFAGGFDAAQAWVRSEWGDAFVDFDPENLVRTVANELITRHVIDKARGCVRCPACGRFYIQRRAYENDYDGYAPEPAIRSLGRGGS